MLNNGAFLMLCGCLCYSWVPAAIVVAGGDIAPLSFNCLYRTGGFLGGVALLAFLWRRGFLRADVWEAMRDGTRPVDWLMINVQFYGFTAFAWSASYVDAAVTAMVYEMWPMLFMLMMGRVLGRMRWFSQLSPREVVQAGVCFTGVAMVVASERGLVGAIDGNVGLGVGIAVLGMVLTATSFWNFRWCGVVVALLEERRGRRAGRGEWLAILVTGFTLGSGVAALVNGLAADLVGEQVGSSPGWALLGLVAVAGGFVLDAGGTVFNRWANLQARRISVNAINYAIPALGVTWLLVLSLTDVRYVWLLVVGAVVTVGANMSLLWGRGAAEAVSQT